MLDDNIAITSKMGKNPQMAFTVPAPWHYRLGIRELMPNR